jgi:MoaA/NifB/PqqE/SkfB family radical SAM enzyme
MMAFHIYPGGDVYFCWELPHRTQMMNILMNPDLFDPERIQQLKRWENLQLEYFGFKKDENGNWVENELYRGDQLMTSSQKEKNAVKLVLS